MKQLFRGCRIIHKQQSQEINSVKGYIMELIGFLLFVVIVIGLIKVAALLFKTTFFLISIPFQIIGALLLSGLLFILIPVGFITGILSIILAPLALLIPLMPFILIAVGIYLLAR